VDRESLCLIDPGEANMTCTVLEHPLSPYAQKVKLALHFKGVDFDVEQPMVGSDLEEFAAASPRGEVPVLRHDGINLYDSAVIGAYIDETWADPPLLPAAPIERAGIRLIEDAMDTHFESNTWGLGEVLVFGRAEGEQADRMCGFAAAQIQGWYRWLESRIAATDWFNGRAYGWGDICVVPFVNGAARFDILPEPGTRLADWLARVNAREDVQTVTAAAQAAELDPDMMRAALEGGFKREYRDHRLEWMIRAGGIDVVAKGLAADNIRFNGSFA
jgi:glutathione S-transferase/RNA polymerase-associated protein